MAKDKLMVRWQYDVDEILLPSLRPGIGCPLRPNRSRCAKSKRAFSWNLQWSKSGSSILSKNADIIMQAVRATASMADLSQLLRSIFIDHF